MCYFRLIPLDRITYPSVHNRFFRRRMFDVEAFLTVSTLFRRRNFDAEIVLWVIKTTLKLLNFPPSMF